MYLFPDHRSLHTTFIVKTLEIFLEVLQETDDDTEFGRICDGLPWNALKQWFFDRYR